jgi:hypothetical protein
VCVLRADSHRRATFANKYCIKGKGIICPQVLIDGGHANAGDHDFHCVNFTPSVNLIVDVKAPSGNEVVDDVLQSFYRGKNMRVVLN